MFYSCKKRLLSLTLALLMPAGLLCAQAAPEMNLKLAEHGSDKDSVKTNPPAEFGRFSLMLDNQFGQSVQSEDKDPSVIAELHITPPTDGTPIEKRKDDGLSNVIRDVKLHSDDDHPRSFSQTITLNNSYEENSIGFRDGPSDGISGSSRSGRLRLYGSYDQQRVPAVTDVSERTPAVVNNAIRGSVVDNNDAQLTLKGGNAAMSSNYYLEASYDFQPAFTGRVSFRRSVIDTFDSEEELRIEGVVETSENTEIKVGYNNEASPKVEVPKNSLETTVWTEFILKF